MLEYEYSEDQIESVLGEIGVDVISETEQVFLTYCPFHKNTDSPSFAVNKITGLYICFSPMCDERGNLLQLIGKITHMNVFAARRLIEKNDRPRPPVSEQIDYLLEKKAELEPFPQEDLDRMFAALPGSPAQEYMRERGFLDETLETFQVGYSANQNMVTVPVHDWDGNSVGLVGRSIEEKSFKNSKNLPTSKVLFNTHRAKVYSDTVIVVESSMDAMRIHQSGFPFVVATLGGFFTESHKQIIDKYFNHIVIMTDFDDREKHKNLHCNKCDNTCLGHNAGRALGEKIIKSLPHKRIKWASYDYGIVYPHGAKDAGDLTEEEIKTCIVNAVSVAEYELWKRDFDHLRLI